MSYQTSASVSTLTTEMRIRLFQALEAGKPDAVDQIIRSAPATVSREEALSYCIEVLAIMLLAEASGGTK